MERLRTTLGTYTTANLTDFLKVKPASSADGGEKVSALLPVLSTLAGYTALVGKKAYADDFGTFVEFMREYPEISLSSFYRPAPTPVSAGIRRVQNVGLNQTLVDQYASQLAAALGNDSTFMAIYARLKNDKGMKKPEMAALADQFNGPVAPSTTKTKALEKIFSRHRKLREFVSSL
jgi:hypothetical protein